MQIASMQAALLPADPGLYAYLLLGVATAFQLPRWGRSVLAFLRDLDEYRANRPQRRSQRPRRASRSRRRD